MIREHNFLLVNALLSEFDFTILNYIEYKISLVILSVVFTQGNCTKTNIFKNTLFLLGTRKTEPKVED